MGRSVQMLYGAAGLLVTSFLCTVASTITPGQIQFWFACLSFISAFGAIGLGILGAIIYWDR